MLHNQATFNFKLARFGQHFVFFAELSPECILILFDLHFLLYTQEDITSNLTVSNTTQTDTKVMSSITIFRNKGQFDAASITAIIQRLSSADSRNNRAVLSLQFPKLLFNLCG